MNSVVYKGQKEAQINIQTMLFYTILNQNLCNKYNSIVSLTVITVIQLKIKFASWCVNIPVKLFQTLLKNNKQFRQKKRSVSWNPIATAVKLCFGVPNNKLD